MSVYATCTQECLIPCDGRCRGGNGAKETVADLPPKVAALARVVRVSDVKAEHVSWLWQGYIPRGKLTLIDGDPGDGKSTLSLDIAARVTTSSPMPDGSVGMLGNVLVLSAEDGIGDTIRPRLDAAGADTTRVMVLHEIVEGDEARPPELPADIDHMRRLIKEHKVVLVIIDPLMAFLAGVDSHNDQSVRRALHPLAKLADDTGAAILVVRHLNKASGGKALYRGGGSIGISGAARAVFLVASDPEDEDRRLLASVKVNIAVKPPTMAYRVVADELHECSRIQWDGVVEATADELVNVEPAEERAEKLAATEFLAACLANGPRRTKDVEDEALQTHGISQRTLFRARAKLQVKADQMATGPNGKNEWWLSLPSQNDTADCQTAVPCEWQSGSLLEPPNGLTPGLWDHGPWTHTAPGRGKPGVGRPITTVTYRPDGWFTSGGRNEDGTYDHMATCRSIFWMSQEDYHDSHREVAVSFRVETIERNKVYSHYLCPEHLASSPREEDIFARSLVPSGLLGVTP